MHPSVFSPPHRTVVCGKFGVASIVRVVQLLRCRKTTFTGVPPQRPLKTMGGLFLAHGGVLPPFRRDRAFLTRCCGRVAWSTTALRLSASCSPAAMDKRRRRSFTWSGLPESIATSISRASVRGAVRISFERSANSACASAGSRRVKYGVGISLCVPPLCHSQANPPWVGESGNYQAPTAAASTCFASDSDAVSRTALVTQASARSISFAG